MIQYHIHSVSNYSTSIIICQYRKAPGPFGRGTESLLNKYLITKGNRPAIRAYGESATASGRGENPGLVRAVLPLPAEPLRYASTKYM